MVCGGGKGGWRGAGVAGAGGGGGGGIGRAGIVRGWCHIRSLITSSVTDSC